MKVQSPFFRNLHQFFFCCIAVCLLSGCVMGREETVAESGVIHNPSIGWNGFSVKIPRNYRVFNPDEMELSGSSNKETFYRALKKDEKGYATAFSVAYHERFLLEDEKDASCIIFTVDIWEFERPLAKFTSLEKDRLLQRLLRDNLVKINDTDAFREIITINGHRAFHVRGNNNLDFKDTLNFTDYEQYFILGDLKEVYRVIGFSLESEKEAMQKATRKMAESLEI